MKKLIALALVTVGISLSARAQWVVYDPTMNIQQILDQAENIVKYVEMIDNQVQQIQTLTDQLSEFKHYEDLFGDPKSVLLSTLKPLTDDLRKTELGQTLTTLEGTVKNHAITNQVERLILRRTLPAILGRTVFGFDVGIKGILPGPRRNARITSSKIRLGDEKI